MKTEKELFNAQEFNALNALICERLTSEKLVEYAANAAKAVISHFHYEFPSTAKENGFAMLGNALRICNRIEYNACRAKAHSMYAKKAMKAMSASKTRAREEAVIAVSSALTALDTSVIGLINIRCDVSAFDVTSEFFLQMNDPRITTFANTEIIKKIEVKASIVSYGIRQYERQYERPYANRNRTNS